MRKIIFRMLQIGLISLGLVAIDKSSTLAQVTSDGTVNTQVNTNGNVAEITGGETRGSNLFHSFQDFFVPTNNEAFFNNANDISNIFSRVTGGNISNAEQGQGGNIDITAEAILGIQERELNDSTNDINASSQFSLDGSVNITTPDLNPIEGAIELPRNVVYPGETTAQTCNSDRQQAGNNSLILAGKGGIASSPAAPLDSENLTIDGEVDNSITRPSTFWDEPSIMQPFSFLSLDSSH